MFLSLLSQIVTCSTHSKEKENVDKLNNSYVDNSCEFRATPSMPYKKYFGKNIIFYMLIWINKMSFGLVNLHNQI